MNREPVPSAQGLEHAPTAAQAIGYTEALACLRGECSEAEAVERTASRTRQLAKRQMTWFKRNKKIHWVKNGTDAKKILENFLKNKGERNGSPVGLLLARSILS